MLGERVLALRSWGKHFLIGFDGFTLRVHFMLFGSYRINERRDTAPPAQPARATAPRLTYRTKLGRRQRRAFFRERCQRLYC